MQKLIVAFLIFTLTPVLYAAEPIVVKWDKGKSGYTIAAFDPATRNVRWDIAPPCRSPNFVRKTSRGIMVGCNDSNVVMLDPSTGKELWRRNLVSDAPAAINGAYSLKRRYDIDGFAGERPEGFVLYQKNEDAYFFIGANGEYLLRCNDTCGEKLMSAKLHAGKTLLMRWKGPSQWGAGAFDIAAGRMAWEWYSCSAANFAEHTSMGVLVGCEDSMLVMLNPETGKEIWRRDLSAMRWQNGKRFDVDRYHGERPEGFLVSQSSDLYLMINKNGDVLLHCEQQCADPARAAIAPAVQGN